VNLLAIFCLVLAIFCFAHAAALRSEIRRERRTRRRYDLPRALPKRAAKIYRLKKFRAS